MAAANVNRLKLFPAGIMGGLTSAAAFHLHVRSVIMPERSPRSGSNSISQTFKSFRRFRFGAAT
jgi:hypothetical protein